MMMMMLVPVTKASFNHENARVDNQSNLRINYSLSHTLYLCTKVNAIRLFRQYNDLEP